MGALGGKAVNAIGKTKGGWGTKIHIVVDGLGYPIDLLLTESQVNDNIVAEQLLKGKRSQNVIADKAYDTNNIREMLAEEEKIAVIPNQGRRIERFEYDKDMYKERHLVECFFQKIKCWRRIATRYEKTIGMFTGMLTIACILTWVMF
jgi:transposase